MGLIIALAPPPCLIRWAWNEFGANAPSVSTWKAYPGGGTTHDGRDCGWFPDDFNLRQALLEVWPKELKSHTLAYLSPWIGVRPPEIVELADLIRDPAPTLRVYGSRFDGISKMIPLILSQPQEAQRKAEAVLAMRLLSRTDGPERRVF